LTSLRRRLLVPLLPAVCLLVLATGFATSGAISRRLSRGFDRSLLTHAQALAVLTEQNAGAMEVEVAYTFLPWFTAGDESSFFEVWRDDGKVVEKSPSLGPRDLPRSGSIGRKPIFHNLELPNGRPGRLVEISFVPRFDDDVPVQDSLPGSRMRKAVLVIAHDRGRLDALVRSLYATAATSAAVLALVLGLLVHTIVRRGLAPLDDIGRQVEALDAARLDLRLHARPPIRELVPIVDRLNALLARLQAAFERERRFSSDLAHELRTPVAEMRNLAEVGALWSEDRVLVQRFFEDVGAISRQMEGLVTNLLALARCDSGQEVVEQAESDLPELLSEAWERHAPVARKRGLEFRLTAPPLLFLGDRAKLGLIFSNLFSNAVVYSPEGSTISCSAAVLEGTLEVEVANPAPGLGPEDLPFLFERFWRKDSARTDSLHAGLGLSLARSFAELLGLRLTARLDAQGRLALRLAGEVFYSTNSSRLSWSTASLRLSRARPTRAGWRWTRARW
jgi:two-component system sensor histidine kinase QseC